MSGEEINPQKQPKRLENFYWHFAFDAMDEEQRNGYIGSLMHYMVYEHRRRLEEHGLWTKFKQDQGELFQEIVRSWKSWNQEQEKSADRAIPMSLSLKQSLSTAMEVLLSWGANPADLNM